MLSNVTGQGREGIRAVDSSIEYRNRAFEADAKGEAATDRQLKQSWHECAASWRLMAELAERQESDVKTPANDA